MMVVMLWDKVGLVVLFYKSCVLKCVCGLIKLGDIFFLDVLIV